MKSSPIIQKLIKIAKKQQSILHKLAQMGVQEEIEFISPQYFASACLPLFKRLCNNDHIHIAINADSVQFMDGSGELDSQQLQNLLKDCCYKVERLLHYREGEIFNYSSVGKL